MILSPLKSVHSVGINRFSIKLTPAFHFCYRFGIALDSTVEYKKFW